MPEQTTSLTVALLNAQSAISRGLSASTESERKAFCFVAYSALSDYADKEINGKNKKGKVK